MLFRINEIGLFQKQKKDVVKFHDEINFISGESNTGKSSIGEIIDYCLGSSKQTVPSGKIVNEIDIFSISLTMDTYNILIARNRFDAQEFEGKKFIFLKTVKDTFSLLDIGIEFFNDNKSEYFTKDDFLELEISKYFPSFPPKTRLDGKEMVRPTVRNMPPFMFQVQDIIKNKSHLFYQMDRGAKIKGIKRDFELFLGLVDFSIYNKINRRNEIIKELKKIENSQGLYEDQLKHEYFNLRNSYHRLFTHLDKNIDEERLNNEYLLNLDNLNGLKLEYTIDSDVGKNIEILETKASIQSKVVENLKIEFSNIQSQIQHIDTANLKLNINPEIEYTKHCPVCDSEVKEMKIFEIAKQKILEEKNFLSNYNSDILREKSLEVKEKLNKEKAVLKDLISSIDRLKKDVQEIKTIEEKRQLLYKIKGMIEKIIETIIEYEKKMSDTKKKEELESELDELDKLLTKVDIKKKRQEAELHIGKYSTEMLETLPFDKNDYGEPNLKFDIKDVTSYQQTDTNVYYLPDIGSAENHLAFHLSIFLGLHKYILVNSKSILPSLIFLDQPSQVYFPKEEDFKNATGDIQKVENLYKSIIDFVTNSNNNSMLSKIQIIIVDHFYSDEDWYQKYLVEPRWEKDQKLGLIKG